MLTESLSPEFMHCHKYYGNSVCMKEGGKPHPSPKCLSSLGLLRIKRRTYDSREGREMMWSSFLLSPFLVLLMYVYIHMCAGPHRGPRVVLEPQELESQVG